MTIVSLTEKTSLPLHDSLPVQGREGGEQERFPHPEVVDPAEGVVDGAGVGVGPVGLEGVGVEAHALELQQPLLLVLPRELVLPVLDKAGLDPVADILGEQDRGELQQRPLPIPGPKAEFALGGRRRIEEPRLGAWLCGRGAIVKLQLRAGLGHRRARDTPQLRVCLRGVSAAGSGERQRNRTENGGRTPHRPHPVG